MTLSRRTVVRGAAWTGPAIAVAAAAPAYAATGLAFQVYLTVDGPACDQASLRIENTGTVEVTFTQGAWVDGLGDELQELPGDITVPAGSPLSMNGGAVPDGTGTTFYLRFTFSGGGVTDTITVGPLVNGTCETADAFWP